MKIDCKNINPLKKGVSEIKVLHNTNRTNDEYLEDMRTKDIEIGRIRRNPRKER